MYRLKCFRKLMSILNSCQCPRSISSLAHLQEEARLPFMSVQSPVLSAIGMGDSWPRVNSIRPSMFMSVRVIFTFWSCWGIFHMFRNLLKFILFGFISLSKHSLNWCVAQAGFLVVLLHQIHKTWVHRCALQCPVHMCFELCSWKEDHAKSYSKQALDMGYLIFSGFHLIWL